MSWWPFRCKEQSSPEDDPDEVITITATPYAGRVSEMLAAGWPGDQIVAVLLLQESVDSHSTLATDILSELAR